MKADKEQRDKLLEKISGIDDQRVIDEIYRLLAINFDDSIYITSAPQRHAVAEARKQIEKGNVLSEGEANDEVEKWLGK